MDLALLKVLHLRLLPSLAVRLHQSYKQSSLFVLAYYQQYHARHLRL